LFVVSASLQKTGGRRKFLGGEDEQRKEGNSHFCYSQQTSETEQAHTTTTEGPGRKKEGAKQKPLEQTWEIKHVPAVGVFKVQMSGHTDEKEKGRKGFTDRRRRWQYRSNHSFRLRLNRGWGTKHGLIKCGGDAGGKGQKKSNKRGGSRFVT